MRISLVICLTLLISSCKKDEEQILISGKWDVEWRSQNIHGETTIMKGSMNFKSGGAGVFKESRSTKSQFVYSLSGNTVHFTWSNPEFRNSTIVFNQVIHDKKYQVWEQVDMDPGPAFDSITVILKK